MLSSQFEHLRISPPALLAETFKNPILLVSPTVTSLHLESTTTAGQVVAQFCRLHGVERLVSTPEEIAPSPLTPISPSSSSPPSSHILAGFSSLHKDPEEPYRLFLYEVAGNIGERRLDPETNMKEALSRNPNATWVVKNRLQTAK